MSLWSTGEKWDQSDMHHMVPYQAQLFPPPVTPPFFVKGNKPGMMKYFVVLKKLIFYVKMDLVKILFFD